MHALEYKEFEEVLGGLPKLLPQLPDAQILGMGESTHGTHEFFANKSLLFQYLVEDHNYQYLAFEDHPNSVMPLDRYIHGQTADITQAIAGLYKVWQVAEVRDFLKNLRKLVKNGSNITISGIDVDQNKIKPEQRDQLMAKNVLHLAEKGKVFVWSHNAHTQKAKESGLYEHPMGYFLSQELEGRYCAIGQFFNRGTVSAATIDETSPDHSPRTLATHKIAEAPEGHIEQVLASKYQQVITRTNDYGKILKSRSLGWGVVPQQLNSPNMYYENTRLADDYDAVIFIDEVVATQPLLPQ